MDTHGKRRLSRSPPSPVDAGAPGDGGNGPGRRGTVDAGIGRDGGGGPGKRWQRRFAGSRIRGGPTFSTLSGVDPGAGVRARPRGPVVPGFDRIGWPGEYPVQPAASTRPGTAAGAWTIRQFPPGSANARQTNERYKMLLGAGRPPGLSVAFEHAHPDGPGTIRRPRASARRGPATAGVAIDSAADMDTLFAGIPLADVTTIDDRSAAPAVPVFCMYLGRRPAAGAPTLAALDGDAADRHLQGVHRAERNGCSPPEPAPAG